MTILPVNPGQFKYLPIFLNFFHIVNVFLHTWYNYPINKEGFALARINYKSLAYILGLVKSASAYFAKLCKVKASSFSIFLISHSALHLHLFVWSRKIKGVNDSNFVN